MSANRGRVVNANRAMLLSANLIRLLNASLITLPSASRVRAVNAKRVTVVSAKRVTGSASRAVPRAPAATPPPQASTEAFTPPAPAPASRVPSIGRAEPRRPQREVESEPADHSHLPAFLLRPVRARV